MPSLPTDVRELQVMILDFYKKFEELEKKYQCYEAENKVLRERVQLLVNQIFGRKSEKIHLLLDDNFRQLSLFSDSEEPGKAGIGIGIEDTDIEGNEVVIAGYKRKKRGRRALPEELPRVEIIHDIEEKEKICGCGCAMSRIGEEVSEQLEMQPARFLVVRNIRPKYACRNCEGLEKVEGERTVKISAPPVQLIPKSICTPSLLSHLFVSKFCDGLPFYRQEGLFKRIGFELSRTTMCTWAMKVNKKLEPLIELLGLEILSGPSVNIDETPVQVLREPGRSFETKSFMWVFRGGTPDKPIILYRYKESRSGNVAAKFLGDYQGYVQTDGYGGYDFLDNRKGIIHVGCWAHSRRKFLEVIRASVKVKGKGKGKGKGNGNCEGKGEGSGKAEEGLRIIQKLYAVEKNARKQGLSPEMIYIERQEKSKPILDDFKLWLEEIAPTVPVKSLLGKALTYTLSQWHRLIRYLENGIIRIDNNLVENDIRPFVLGRKNWLFFDQPEGATAGANLYSLIETAKANGLEPYQYFCFLFDKLPLVASEAHLKALLPQNLTPEILEIHQLEYQERWKPKK